MIQFHIQNVTFEGQEQAISELVDLALQVAKNQRGEDHLQPLTDIRFKILREVQEFAESEGFYKQAAELADIVYYSVQSFAQDRDEVLLHRVIQHFAEHIMLDEERAFQVALAKYRTRASAPDNKDFEAEHAAIVAVFKKGQ